MSTVQDNRAADNKNNATAQARQSRRGSETRKPSKLVHVRYPLDEFSRLESEAELAGLTLSAFVRAQTNGIKPTAASKRTSPERRLAAQYLAQLGKIGSNLNQFVRAVHLHQAESDEVTAALKEIGDLKALLQRILRTEP
jgi:hypothetical protein